MQACRDDKCPDDDMADGDLGDGMEVRKASMSARKKSQSFAGATETELSHLKRLGSSIQNLEVSWVNRMKKTENEMRTDWNKPSCLGKTVYHATFSLATFIEKKKVIRRLFGSFIDNVVQFVVLVLKCN